MPIPLTQIMYAWLRAIIYIAKCLVIPQTESYLYYVRYSVQLQPIDLLESKFPSIYTKNLLKTLQIYLYK